MKNWCPICKKSNKLEICDKCKNKTIPLFDKNGALSSEFLLLRGFCCKNNCRNCPYRSKND